MNRTRAGEFAEVSKALAGRDGAGSILGRLLNRLATSGAPERWLMREVWRQDPGALPHLYYCISVLDGRGLLSRTLLHGRSAPLVTIEPISRRYVHQELPVSGRTVVELSRYALLRRDRDVLVAEPALGNARVLIWEPRCLVLMAHLGSTISVGELSARARSLFSNAQVRKIVSALLASGVAEQSGSDCLSKRAKGECWEFHDLIFHLRSREGWTVAPTGGTYRFAGTNQASVATKTPPPGEVSKLPRPRRKVRSETFLQVLRRRRSLRDAPHSLTAQGLSDLLHYAARPHVTPAKDSGASLAERAYPCAGALYELELYVVTVRCGGLWPGISYYSPLTHSLHRVASGRVSLALLRDAKRAAQAVRLPDALLVVTARFRRVFWKYESIAYSLIIKDAGCLIQTLALTATALELALCPLGTLDSRLFCEAVGLDPLVECPVAELMLPGSLLPDA